MNYLNTLQLLPSIKARTPTHKTLITKLSTRMMNMVMIKKPKARKMLMATLKMQFQNLETSTSLLYLKSKEFLLKI